MRYIPFIGVSILLLILLFQSCDSGSTKSEQGILFPNNDSELTMLMREMFLHFEALKKEIASGKKPKDINVFLDIHSAPATDPKKSESDLYKVMAEAYLASAKRLEGSNNPKKVFNIVVDNCMNCHKQLCPGPMVKIKKLYITEDLN